MCDITFTADEGLIDRARDRARRENRSLEEAFRDWLGSYAGESAERMPFEEVMLRLSHVKFERTFTRDEMNQR
jgi:hypothetical protein